MEKYTVEDTISESKEESIAKAIHQIQCGCSSEAPLHRPDISLAKILAGFALWLFLVGSLLFACIHLGELFDIPRYIVHPAVTVACMLIIAFKSKSMVKNSVLIYQRYAPEKTRRACLFTPSCSEYMLLAVEKYGVIVGVYKGLRRLSRCHHPNGGVDYP